MLNKCQQMPTIYPTSLLAPGQRPYPPNTNETAVLLLQEKGTLYHGPPRGLTSTHLPYSHNPFNKAYAY